MPSCTSADLRGANLSGAKLTNADFLNAHVSSRFIPFISNQKVRNFHTIQWKF